jgi:hypothetical protein
MVAEHHSKVEAATRKRRFIPTNENAIREIPIR